MSITKQTFVGQIDVAANACVQVRLDTQIIEDGNVISTSLHRYVIVPGQDYSNEPDQVKAICAAAQTPKAIAAYQASIAQTD
mgnify:CR=1 FL=1